MRATTRQEMLLAVICAGVMGAGAVFVGVVPFRRAVATARHMSLSPKISGCGASTGDVTSGPDVYIVPMMGFDRARSQEVVSHLKTTLMLSVAMAPSMRDCAGCVTRGEANLEQMYGSIKGHMPKLLSHRATVRIGLTEVDVASRDPSGDGDEVFGRRATHPTVAVLSTNRLGEDAGISLGRLNKLAARYAAQMSMRCSGSSDPRSIVHDAPLRTVDDIDVMQMPSE